MGWYKNAIRFSTYDEAEDAIIEQTIRELSLPDEVKAALITALQECENSYCQTYLRSLPRALEHGKQIGKPEHAVKVQVNYIYANMEDYDNEKVKTILADWLGIAPENRHGELV